MSRLFQIFVEEWLASLKLRYVPQWMWPLMENKTLVHNKLRKLGTKNCWVDFCESLLDEIDVTDEENLALDEQFFFLPTYLTQIFQARKGETNIFLRLA